MELFPKMRRPVASRLSKYLSTRLIGSKGALYRTVKESEEAEKAGEEVEEEDLFEARREQGDMGLSLKDLVDQILKNSYFNVSKGPTKVALDSIKGWNDEFVREKFLPSSLFDLFPVEKNIGWRLAVKDLMKADGNGAGVLFNIAIIYNNCITDGVKARRKGGESSGDVEEGLAQLLVPLPNVRPRFIPISNIALASMVRCFVHPTAAPIAGQVQYYPSKDTAIIKTAGERVLLLNVIKDELEIEEEMKWTHVDLAKSGGICGRFFFQGFIGFLRR
jgi:hypothetical protein